MSALAHVRSRVVSGVTIRLPSSKLLCVMRSSVSSTAGKPSFLRCQLAMSFFRLALQRCKALDFRALVPALCRPFDFHPSLRGELLRALVVCLAGSAAIPPAEDSPLELGVFATGAWPSPPPLDRSYRRVAAEPARVGSAAAPAAASAAVASAASGCTSAHSSLGPRADALASPGSPSAITGDAAAGSARDAVESAGGNALLVARLLLDVVLLQPELGHAEHRLRAARADDTLRVAREGGQAAEARAAPIAELEAKRSAEWASLPGVSARAAATLFGSAGSRVVLAAMGSSADAGAGTEGDAALRAAAAGGQVTLLWAAPCSAAQRRLLTSEAFPGLSGDELARALVAAQLDSAILVQLQQGVLRFVAAGHLPRPLSVAVAVGAEGAAHHSVSEAASSFLARVGTESLELPPQPAGGTSSEVALAAIAASYATTDGPGAAVENGPKDWPCPADGTLPPGIRGVEHGWNRAVWLPAWSLRQLFTALLGTRAARGAAPALLARRAPAAHSVRVAILGRLAKSKLAAAAVAECLRCVVSGLFGSLSTTQTRRAAAALCSWMLRKSPSHRLKAVGPALTKTLLRAATGRLEQAGRPLADAANLQSVALGLLPAAAQASSAVIAASDEVATSVWDLLERAIEAGRKEEALAASQAAAALARAYKQAPAPVLESLGSRLLAMSSSPDHRTRQVSLEWAREAFPSTSVLRACIAFQLAGDSRAEHRDAATRLLTPTRPRRSLIAEGAGRPRESTGASSSAPLSSSTPPKGFLDPAGLLRAALSDPIAAALESDAVHGWWTMYEPDSDPFDLARPIPRASNDPRATGFAAASAICTALLRPAALQWGAPVSAGDTRVGDSPDPKRPRPSAAEVVRSGCAFARLPPLGQAAAIATVVASLRAKAEATASVRASTASHRPDAQSARSLQPTDALRRLLTAEASSGDRAAAKACLSLCESVLSRHTVLSEAAATALSAGDNAAVVAASSALAAFGLAAPDMVGEHLHTRGDWVRGLLLSGHPATRACGAMLIGCVVRWPGSGSRGQAVELLADLLDMAGGQTPAAGRVVSSVRAPAVGRAGVEEERDALRRVGATLAIGHALAVVSGLASQAGGSTNSSGEAASAAFPPSLVAACASTLVAGTASPIEELQIAAVEAMTVLARAQELPFLDGVESGADAAAGGSSRMALVRAIEALASIRRDAPTGRNHGTVAGDARRLDDFETRHARALGAMASEGSRLRLACVKCLGAIARGDSSPLVRDAAVAGILRVGAARDEESLARVAGALVEACCSGLDVGERVAGGESVAARLLLHCLTVSMQDRDGTVRLAGAVWALSVVAAFGARPDVSSHWELARAAFFQGLGVAAPGSALAETCSRGLALVFDETTATTSDGLELTGAASATSYTGGPYCFDPSWPCPATVMAGAEAVQLLAAKLHGSAVAPSFGLHAGPTALLAELAAAAGDVAIFYSLAALIAEPPPRPAPRPATSLSMAAGQEEAVATGEAVLPLVLTYLRAVACARCMPFLPALVPPLVLALHDPRKDRRVAAQRIWAGLTVEPTTALATFAARVLDYVSLVASRAADWRIRAAALETLPSALSELGSGTMGAAMLARAWQASVRGLCDSSEPVAKAASQAAAKCALLSRSQCDPAIVGPSVAAASLAEVLPVLLRDGLDAPYRHARLAALRAVVSITGAARAFVLPWASSIMQALLQVIPDLEDSTAEFLQSHANAGGGTALDLGGVSGATLEAARLAAVRASPAWGVVDNLVAQVREASAAQLAGPCLSLDSPATSRTSQGSSDGGAQHGKPALLALLETLSESCAPARALLARGAASFALRDVLSAAGSLAAPFVAVPMRRLVAGGVLSDPSAPVRRFGVSALAQAARIAPMEDFRTLLADIESLAVGRDSEWREVTSVGTGALGPWDLATGAWEDPTRPSPAAAGAAASQAAEWSKADWAGFKGSSVAAAEAALALSSALEGERWTIARDSLFPLAFVGLSALGSDDGDQEKDAWQAAAKSFTPGTVASALRVAAPQVVLAARAAMRSPVWARRRAGAAALAAAVKLLSPAESLPFSLLDGVSGAAFSPCAPPSARASRRRDGSTAEGLAANLDAILPASVPAGGANLPAASDPRPLLPSWASSLGVSGAGRLRNAGAAALGPAIVVPELSGERSLGPLSAAVLAMRGRWWSGKEAVLDAALACACANPSAVVSLGPPVRLLPGALALLQEAIRAATRTSTTPALVRACGLRVATTVLLLASSMAVASCERKEPAAPAAGCGDGDAPGARPWLSAAGSLCRSHCGRLGASIADALEGCMAPARAADQSTEVAGGDSAGLPAGGGDSSAGLGAVSASTSKPEMALAVAALQFSGAVVAAAQHGVVSTGGSPCCLAEAFFAAGERVISCKSASGLPLVQASWQLQTAASQAVAAVSALLVTADGSCAAAPSTSLLRACLALTGPDEAAHSEWPSNARLVAANCAVSVAVAAARAGGASSAELVAAALRAASATARKASLPVVAGVLEEPLGHLSGID